MRLPRLFSPGPRVRIFAALTIASAAVISFESLKHLAEYAGFGHFSFLFPLTLDAVAALGMDLWVTRSPAWKQARALALAAIGGSLVGNIADHWISQGTVLPAVLGAVPPGMLAALLAVLHKHASGTATHRSGPDPAVRDAIWSALAQGPTYRTVRTGPATYMVPDRIWSLDRSAPFEGPAVGPMVRTGSAFAQRLRSANQRSVGVETTEGWTPKTSVQPSAPKPVRGVGLADEVVLKAIRTVHTETGRWPSKNDVMREHRPMGTNRALRLIREAKETEVS